MEEKCEVCFKIKCKGCGWEPTDQEVILIQKEILSKCPICSWRPSNSVSAPKTNRAV